MRGEKLELASEELFEVGILEVGPLSTRYVRRLNTMTARRRADMEKNVPPRLNDAINAKGMLKKQAELVVFGQWLLNGSPGAKRRPGRQADPKKVLN